MKIGQQLDTWFPGGVVLEFRPYIGKYPQWFTYIVRVTAPRTNRGWLEIVV